MRKTSLNVRLMLDFQGGSCRMLDCLFYRFHNEGYPSVGGCAASLRSTHCRFGSGSHLRRSCFCCRFCISKAGRQCRPNYGGRRPSDVTDFIAKNIMARNLPYASLLRVPGTNSPFSAIQVESNGKRCITHFGGCIRQLTLDMLDKQALADTNMIHLGA